MPPFLQRWPAALRGGSGERLIPRTLVVAVLSLLLATSFPPASASADGCAGWWDAGGTEATAATIYHGQWCNGRLVPPAGDVFDYYRLDHPSGTYAAISEYITVCVSNPAAGRMSADLYFVRTGALTLGTTSGSRGQLGNGECLSLSAHADAQAALLGGYWRLSLGPGSIGTSSDDFQYSLSIS